MPLDLPTATSIAELIKHQIVALSSAMMANGVNPNNNPSKPSPVSGQIL